VWYMTAAVVTRKTALLLSDKSGGRLYISQDPPSVFPLSVQIYYRILSPFLPSDEKGLDHPRSKRDPHRHDGSRFYQPSPVFEQPAAIL